MIRYGSLEWLKEQEGFFLTRPQSRVCVFDRPSGQPLDVEEIGPKGSLGTWQGEVLVGQRAKWPARLILVRVPEEVIEPRHAPIRKEGPSPGQSRGPSRSLKPRQMDHFDPHCARLYPLTISEVIVLQRARWQIDGLFRLWKEGGKSDEWRGRTRWRILGEIYLEGLDWPFTSYLWACSRAAQTHPRMIT